MRWSIVIMLAACSSGTRSSPPPDRAADLRTADAAPAPRPMFSLREVSVRHDGVALGPDAKLHSRDRFDIVLDVAGTAHVYVIRVAPGRRISVLYPTATSSPLSGTARIPADPRQIFALDDQAGEEHLYVVAIAETISESAAAVADAVDELEGDGLSDSPPVTAAEPHTTAIDAGVPAAAPPDAGTRPTRSRKKASSRVALRPLDDHDRDVVIVSSEGAATCVNVVPNAQGVAACRFTIKHLP